MANRTLFEVFGENAPPSPLAVINERLKKEKEKEKEYQAATEEPKTVSFSFSPDIPKPQPDSDVKNTVLETSMSDTTEHDSNQKADYKEGFAHMPTSKTDFSSLIQDAENISSVALALEGALTQEKIHWCGTAKILAEQLQKHVAKLKDIAAQ